MIDDSKSVLNRASDSKVLAKKIEKSRKKKKIKNAIY